MKRTLSLIMSLLMVLNICGGIMLSGVTAAAVVKFEDNFGYSAFTADTLTSSGIWEAEYKETSATDDYGYFDGTLPEISGNKAILTEGDGLRLNWQKISGFTTFSNTKTYTMSFDIKVTDFGDNQPLHNTAAWNREFYFGVGGYYNQIEFRSGNYDNQLGIRAGDSSTAYPKGGWTNDLTTYTKNTVYTCKIEWIPAQKTIISTVKNGSTEIAKGIRTSDNYSDVNKYTRSFSFRCEDGSFELDNFTLTDGTNTYTQNFTYTDSNKIMTASGVWGIEDVLKTDALAPTLDGNVLKLGEKGSVRFNWTKVNGIGDYIETNSYIFEFDAKVTDKGDGSTWGGSSNTRALYVAFGGWYNVMELPTSGDTVKIGSTAKTCTDSFINKDLHFTVTLEGSSIKANITDSSGNQLISGERNDAAFTDMEAENAAMTYLVLRCEDGSVEIDNFSLKVEGNTPTNSMALDIPANKQAVYECEMEFTGSDSVALKFAGNDLVYISNTDIKVGGKNISATFGAGTYKVKAFINPTQKMVSVELTGPNGEVSRRGFYNLLGGESLDTYAKGENTVKNETLKYESITLNDYTLVTEEPVYTGYNAKVYNIVSSFDVAQTTRNFAWTVKADYVGTDAMAVKYRVAGTSSWTVVDAVKEVETTETADEDYFKCDLTGLTANTTYEYKIGKKNSTDETNDWSKIYTFKTAKEEIDEFTFIAHGDTQGTSWSGVTTSDKGFMYAKAAYDEAFQEAGDVAFMLHAGDIVERGLNQSYWNYYFKSLGDYGATTPMFAAIGNHDTQGLPFYFDLHFNHPNNGGTAALDSALVAKLTDEYSKNNAKFADETIYSFDYGDAHFIVLNTGSYRSDDQYIIEAQRQWFINDLKANADAKWKIVMFHEPVYHRKGGTEDRPYLFDVIEGYGVDLVIQGHSHLVTRTYPMKNGNIVTKTNPDNIYKGTGTIYTTIGSTTLNHDGASDTVHVEPMCTLKTPAIDQAAYTTIKVNGDKLVVTIKQLDGLVLDSFTIDANVPEQPEIPDDGNIAKNKTYTTTGIYSNESGIPYPDENGLTLTDGYIAKGDAKYDEVKFVGFNTNSEAYQADKYSSITVDLGDKYSINKFVARVSSASDENAGAGVHVIKNFEFYVSDDGQTWTKAGSAAPAYSEESNDTNATLELKDAVAGKYIQYRFTSDTTWMMVSEVEAYGEKYTEPTTPPADDPVTPPADDPVTPPADDPITPPADDPVTPPADDPVTPPAEDPVDPPKDDEEPDDYMLGDVNANGEIDSMDYILLKRNYFGTFKFDEEQFKRGDVTKNGEIDSMDYILLKRAYFGTYTIQ